MAGPRFSSIITNGDAHHRARCEDLQACAIPGYGRKDVAVSKERPRHMEEQGRGVSEQQKIIFDAPTIPPNRGRVHVPR